MTPKQQPDLTQALADLQTVRDEGCPARFSAHTRHWLSKGGVGCSLSRHEVQSTITDIMGWAAVKHGILSRLTTGELGGSPRYYWELSVPGVPNAIGSANTPFAAHAAILRAIREAVEESDAALMSQARRDIEAGWVIPHDELKQQLNKTQDKPVSNDRREAGEDKG